MKTIGKKRRNDLLLFGAVVAVALVVGFARVHFADDGKIVKVVKDGEITGVYSLNEECFLDIEGKNGELNRLVIKDGHAFVSTANCPDKICAEHRPVSKSGETIVCLPHKLVIEIE